MLSPLDLNTGFNIVKAVLAVLNLMLISFYQSPIVVNLLLSYMTPHGLGIAILVQCSFVRTCVFFALKSVLYLYTGYIV